MPETTKGILAGQAAEQEATAAPPKSRAAAKDPRWAIWNEDERRQWATFLARLRDFAPFLVPHTHEGDAPVRRLPFGHPPGLNRSLVLEALGHIRGQAVTRSWPPLGKATDREITGAPTGFPAASFWADATGDGTSWPNFYVGPVAERMLASPGGFIVILQAEGQAETMDEFMQRGLRPRLDFVPFSKMLAFELEGGRFVKVKLEDAELDTTGFFPGDPEAPRHQAATVRTFIVYELDQDGRTRFTRWDADDRKLEELDLGRVEDPDGRPVIGPLVPVRFGEHEEILGLGAGLLSGLADIVIDRYNLVSEARSAYRDMCFAVDVYRGSQYNSVLEQRRAGSRMIDLGAAGNASLSRLTADPGEVLTGKELLAENMREWLLAASRKASDAVAEQMQPRSGVSIAMDFFTSLGPLLTTIAQTLDTIEEETMYRLAQMMGETPEASFAVSVKRGTDFRLEDRISFVARITGEIAAALRLPPELQVALLEQWVAAALPEMEEERRALIVEQAREILEGEVDEAAHRRAAFAEDLEAMRRGAEDLLDEGDDDDEGGDAA